MRTGIEVFRTLLGAAGLLLVVSASVVVPVPYTAAQDVPSDLEAVILLRALSYDRNLQRRSGADLTVGVVYDSEQLASRDCKARMSSAFIANASEKVQDLPVRVTEIKFQSADQLASEADSKGIDVLYICSGLVDHANEITAISRANGLVTLGGSEELVKSGLAIGVAPKGETAKILVNVKAARAEGADLDSRLLMMAELVR